MRIVINLDASTSDLFNEVRGAVGIGGFAALCIKKQLEFLKGKINDIEENKPVRVDEVHS